MDDCLRSQLNSKGQVTVEFVLILVIMLAVLATISLEVVDEVTTMIEDTSLAVNLAAAQQRIVTTAEEVSTGSCGSFKEIGIYIQPSYLSLRNASLYWNETHVEGNFTTAGGNPEELKPIRFPYYISIDNQNCKRVKQNTFYIIIKKDCSSVNPSAREGIGGACP